MASFLVITEGFAIEVRGAFRHAGGARLHVHNRLRFVDSVFRHAIISGNDDRGYIVVVTVAGNEQRCRLVQHQHIEANLCVIFKVGRH